MLERVIPGVGHGEGVVGEAVTKGQLVYNSGKNATDGTPIYTKATSANAINQPGRIGVVYREPIDPEVSTTAEDAIVSGKPVVVYFAGDYITDQFDTTNITSATAGGTLLYPGPSSTLTTAGSSGNGLDGGTIPIAELQGFYEAGTTDYIHFRFLGGM